SMGTTVTATTTTRTTDTIAATITTRTTDTIAATTTTRTTEIIATVTMIVGETSTATKTEFRALLRNPAEQSAGFLVSFTWRKQERKSHHRNLEVSSGSN